MPIILLLCSEMCHFCGSCSKSLGNNLANYVKKVKEELSSTDGDLGTQGHGGIKPPTFGI